MNASKKKPIIESKVDFITRIKKGAAIKVEQVFTDSYGLRDSNIRLGSGTKKTPLKIKNVGV
ncbi:hypothetical protein PN497_11200 [Sphaerospermopsis kisseleviana CS-549]|uniref:Transposase n=1 Tax=Sphaerospermopsis kisseleviana CS-549 TaxID=3021783 RepID=A0ABT4ZT38_9CYAN|nr:hypothetical protein [Sphaerospermopsis kisseleviana]MDB9441923.1 hypothetical protein [Sphaerospermopsis kisseleviana CS-549]BAZ80454.1 transposase, IS4 [Sphaerospermopsis kisseleviana NIES-73]